MDDKDRVFARFKDTKPEPVDRRELLTIPRRAGAPGSRVVEVVHVRAGGATKDRARRVDTQVRAASWEGGFPGRQAAVAPAAVEPVFAEAAKPTTHVMLPWEPAAAKAASALRVDEQVAEAAQAVAPRSPSARKPAKRIADPFDADDDGANCMRCGYAIAPARAKRGLMTCAACG